MSDRSIGQPDNQRYPGGKSASGVPQWIISLLPDHITYAEPFAGHGGIFRRKPPSLRSYLIDRDIDVVNWWHRQQERCRIPAVEIIHGCGIEWMQRAAEAQDEDLLINADPPYLLETRVKKRIYNFEMTDAQHEQFLAVCKMLPGPVVISGYRSPMYLEVLADWSLHTRWVMTRGGTMREECLWSNRSPAAPSPLAMEYSSLGATFRERERVNRKVSRWSKDFARLPPGERRAILLALMSVEREATTRGDIVANGDVGSR